MADDRDIEIRITGNAEDMREALNKANSDVESATKEIRAHFEKTNAGIEASAKQIGAGHERAADAAKQGAQAAKTLGDQTAKLRDETLPILQDLSGGYARLVSALAGIPVVGWAAAAAVAAVAGGGKFAEKTASTIESAMDLARVLGSSTNEARVWQLALEDVGASQGELEGVARGMNRQLKSNEESMKKLGLVTRDASGQFRPMSELVSEGLKVVNSFKAGADRAGAAQVVFGRGISASSHLLLINNETIDSARATMQELGLEVGDNAVKAWKEYDDATDAAGFTIKGLSQTIGSIFMPIIADVVRVFASVMPLAILLAKGALGGLASAFHFAQTGALVFVETVNAMVFTVAEPIIRLGAAMGKLVTGDFAGAANEVKRIGGNISAAWDRSMGNVVASAQKTNDRVRAIFQKTDGAAGTPVGEKGEKSFKNPKEKKGEGALSGFEKELQLLKAKQEAEGEYHEFSKQQELAFWQEKLAQVARGSDDEKAIHLKLLQAKGAISKAAATDEIRDIDTRLSKMKGDFDEQVRLAKLSGDKKIAMFRNDSAKVLEIQAETNAKVAAINQKRDEQERKLAEERASAQMKLAEIGLSIEEEIANQQVAIGQVSQAQRLAMEQEFEDRKLAIKEKAQAELIAAQLLDPNHDPVALQKLLGQMEELHRQHELKKLQIGGKQNDQANKPLNAAIGGTETSVGGALTAMLTREKTAAQALKDLYQSVAKTFIDEMVSKPLAQEMAAWARRMAAKMGFLQSEAAQEQAIAAQTSAQKIATQGAETGVVVAGKAAEGGAAAAAATASTNPWGALAMGGAVLAGILAMRKIAIPSAAGGWDIPSGVTGLMQFHPDEMMLPAPLANRVRNMTEGGGQANVEVNVINQSGTELAAKPEGEPRFDMGRWVQDIVLTAATTNPNFSGQLSQALRRG